MLIKNHLPCSIAIDKGHMHRHQAYAASTQNVQKNIVAARVEVECKVPQQEIYAIQDVLYFAALANAITGNIYTDITGARLPCPRLVQNSALQFCCLCV